MANSFSKDILSKILTAGVFKVLVWAGVLVLPTLLGIWAFVINLPGPIIAALVVFLLACGLSLISNFQKIMDTFGTAEQPFTISFSIRKVDGRYEIYPGQHNNQVRHISVLWHLEMGALDLILIFKNPVKFPCPIVSAENSTVPQYRVPTALADYTRIILFPNQECKIKLEFNRTPV